MNPDIKSGSGDCLPDHLLDAYVLGQVPDETGDHFERHLKHCAKCAAHIESVREEVKRFRRLLDDEAEYPVEPCLAAETLGLYLDKGLSEKEREEVEAHLSRCRTCQNLLVGIFRDVQAAFEPLSDEGSSEPALSKNETPLTLSPEAEPAPFQASAGAPSPPSPGDGWAALACLAGLFFLFLSLAAWAEGFWPWILSTGVVGAAIGLCLLS